MRILRALGLLLVLAGVPAAAYDATGALCDPACEARARDLFRELRCMVCQNQSIDDSDAPLAQDLRALVRERVAAGESNQSIKQFLVARYGEFVLLRPGFNGETLLLWATPIAVLLAGGIVAATSLRRRRASPNDPLSAAEQTRLRKLLGEG